jgi:hypothetical protein
MILVRESGPLSSVVLLSAAVLSAAVLSAVLLSAAVLSAVLLSAAVSSAAVLSAAVSSAAVLLSAAVSSAVLTSAGQARMPFGPRGTRPGGAIVTVRVTACPLRERYPTWAPCPAQPAPGRPGEVNLLAEPGIPQPARKS